MDRNGQKLQDHEPDCNKLPIVWYHLFSTFGLFLNVLFERVTTSIDLCPEYEEKIPDGPSPQSTPLGKS